MAPHGTGPYTVEQYAEGDRALLARREDYWRDGADGQPLRYLDEMEFIEMGREAQVRGHLVCCSSIRQGHGPGAVALAFRAPDT